MLLGPIGNQEHMKEPEKIAVMPAERLYAGLQLEEHRLLFDYWEKIRGKFPMPSRADFDPVDIPRLLPHIGLADIVQPGPRFRYRVVGTAMSARFSAPQDGQFVEDSKSPEYGAFLNRAYSLPYRLRVPVCITERARFSLGYDKIYFRLMLPLGRDRKTPDMILCSTMAQDIDYLDADDTLVDPRDASAIEVVSLRSA